MVISKALLLHGHDGFHEGCTKQKINQKGVFMKGLGDL